MKLGFPLLGWMWVVGFVLASCQPVPAAVQAGSSTALPSSALLKSTVPPMETASPSFTPASTSTQIPPTVALTPALSICSPLEGYSLNQMAGLVSNPFHPSPPGSDDPHQAVDLADRQPDSQIALAGRVVQAVLGGSVAAVIQDRFPYGNALLVETPLEGLPNDLPAALGLSEPAPTPIPNLVLTCPDVVPKNWQASQSLYLLYAHLQKAPAFQPGDPLTCGQALGFVGDSGNALNPHLHLEVRLGPSGARFSSLAHYDNSATLEEMDNYCTWRVRGIFPLVDPMRLLSYSEP
jgi:murein DD-endopeptidase MepM/ murein hydrolase activator NlpD